MPENVDIVMARGGSDTGGLTERQVQIVCVNSMLIFLSTLAVALRFVSRRVMKCRISMDDYVIVFALVCTMSYAMGCHDPTSVSSCFQTDIAFARSPVSESASPKTSTETAD